MNPAVGHLPHPKLAPMDSTSLFHCQTPSDPINCYGPAQIRNAYSIQPLIDNGSDGSGRTITIIDAFQNPTMASDLASFDSRFGLPAPPSFQTIAPFGLAPFDPTDPNQVGWSGEIALDVEWAHAVAPGAKIVLALSPSDADPNLVATEGYVINHGIADVVSMSYTEAEQCMDPRLQQQEHAEFNKANARGVTLFAGSGDQGAAQYTCDLSSFIKAVSTPASDPDVTGVGGTSRPAGDGEASSPGVGAVSGVDGSEGSIGDVVLRYGREAGDKDYTASRGMLRAHQSRRIVRERNFIEPRPDGSRRLAGARRAELRLGPR